MDVRFINPVLETMVSVLEQMANLKPVAGKPSLKQGDVAFGPVTGIIDMISQQATGSISITFSRPVVLELVKRMLRTEIQDVDDMAKDLVGELANIVAGGAKGKLEGQGFNFQLTLPRVVAGEGHSVQHKVTGPTILLPFNTEVGDFHVEICFE